jgi:hypothetical protein
LDSVDPILATWQLARRFAKALYGWPTCGIAVKFAMPVIANFFGFPVGFATDKRREVSVAVRVTEEGVLFTKDDARLRANHDGGRFVVFSMQIAALVPSGIGLNTCVGAVRYERRQISPAIKLPKLVAPLLPYNPPCSRIVFNFY